MGSLIDWQETGTYCGVGTLRVSYVPLGAKGLVTTKEKM